MKRLMCFVCALVFSHPLLAEEGIPPRGIPPRIVVKLLIKAVQDRQTNSIINNFAYEGEPNDLASIPRDDHLQLLKDLQLDKLTFAQDEYVDKGERVTVHLIAPIKLDFKMTRMHLREDIIPPWRYVVLSIRETAQPLSPGDEKPAPEK